MKTKRLAALVIFALCACIFVSTASASMVMQPYYTNTISIVASLKIKGGTATSAGLITPKASSEDRTSRVVVYLQRKTNGKWITIATWSGSKTNASASAGGTKRVTKGYEYRAYVVGTISDEEGVQLERVTKASPTSSY